MTRAWGACFVTGATRPAAREAAAAVLNLLPASTCIDSSEQVRRCADGDISKPSPSAHPLSRLPPPTAAGAVGAYLSTAGAACLPFPQAAAPEFDWTISLASTRSRTSPSFSVFRLLRSSAFVMDPMMEASVFKRLQKSDAVPQELCEMSAIAIARARFIGLCGARSWNDTREAWLARGAHRAGLSLRRARSLFYQQRLRLTADEYLAIERADEAARGALASLSDLARDADAQAHSLAGSARPRAEGPSHSSASGSLNPARRPPVRPDGA